MSSGCGDVLSLADLQTAKKHQLFEAEVITGKAGGVASGADIDFATNQVTGQVQKTLPAVLRDAGFRPAPFTFTTGGTLGVNDADMAVLWPLASGGDGNYYSWKGEMPKVVPASSTPASTGGVGPSAWDPLGDITLRNDLAQPSGASLIGYGSVTVAEKLDTIKTPMDFGAVGDGIADDTLAVQACFDAATGDIDLGGKTYLVRKNAALATTYPTEPDFSDGSYNFSPCTALVGKKNITVRNGHLKTNIHGLDVLSLVNCQNVSISGVRISGQGIFPAIDTLTGYAEKGYPDYGYNTAGGVNLLGPNNSVNSSMYNTGAFNGVYGQFPSYDSAGNPTGSYQSSWGAFLGGYIGSWGCGVKIQRDCKSITIEGCNISGFNYAGVGIGIRNIASPDMADYPNESDVPEGIIISKNTITNCYSNGIGVLCGYKMGYFDNVINNIGHPNGADDLNASFDPGYGIGHGRNRRIRNITASRNFVSNCRRKCIDFHGGGQLIITDNFCLEHGVVGIYAKCGSGWAPNYEPYNLIISNNYVRSRNIPDSTSTGPLAGGRYTRSIDISGGGEATAATYPHPFAKVSNNYCELRAFDGVAISSSAADINWYVFNDIDVSHNTVVLKCVTSNNKAEGIVLNAGATTAGVFRGQTVKLIGNSVKQLNTLNLNYRVVGYRVSGVPKSVIANGNTVDLNAANQTGLLAAFNMDSRTYFSFSGNQALSIGARSSLTSGDIFFYDNARLTIAAGSGTQTIPVSLYRGVWQMTVAGSGDAFGSKQVQYASTGSGGTGADVVRSTTTGFIANIGISATAITVPAVTGQSDVVINLKPIVQYDSVP